MAFSEFKPTIWNDMIFSQYDNALVLAGLANRNYEGEIQSGGERVKILQVGDIDVNNYTGADITFQTPDDAAMYIDIDQKKYAAVSIDSVDALQAKPKMWNETTRKMGVALSETVESFIASKYTEAGIVLGSTGSPTSITSTNVLSHLAEIYRKMSDNKCPKQGRVAVVPPWFTEKIFLSKVAKDTDNSSVLANGFVGRFAGFEVYESNLLASDTAWTASMFFVANDTIAFAQQLTDTRAGTQEKRFDDYVKTLLVYGGKVVRPDSLAVSYSKAGAES